MKAENDKKIAKTSVTMTNEERNIIVQKAAKRGLGVSPYMVECSVRSDDIITPEKRIKVQNIINSLCMIAEDIAPDRISEIQKVGEEVWHL